MPLTNFVGRGAERRALERVLRERRLVTVTGPGGCGKTRLAVETAARWSERDGDDCVVLVDLASVDADVGLALTRALDAPRQPNEPLPPSPRRVWPRAGGGQFPRGINASKIRKAPRLSAVAPDRTTVGAEPTADASTSSGSPSDSVPTVATSA